MLCLFPVQEEVQSSHSGPLWPATAWGRALAPCKGWFLGGGCAHRASLPGWRACGCERHGVLCEQGAPVLWVQPSVVSNRWGQWFAMLLLPLPAWLVQCDVVVCCCCCCVCSVLFVEQPQPATDDDNMACCFIKADWRSWWVCSVTVMWLSCDYLHVLCTYLCGCVPRSHATWCGGCVPGRGRLCLPAERAGVCCQPPQEHVSYSYSFTTAQSPVHATAVDVVSLFLLSIHLFNLFLSSTPSRPTFPPPLPFPPLCSSQVSSSSRDHLDEWTWDGGSRDARKGGRYPAHSQGLPLVSFLHMHRQCARQPAPTCPPSNPNSLHHNTLFCINLVNCTTRYTYNTGPNIVYNNTAPNFVLLLQSL